MEASQILKEKHRHCGCLKEYHLTKIPDVCQIEKDKCKLQLRGLRIAIDCDKCCAFPQNSVRPDLVVLRNNSTEYEWIVIETKGKSKPRAREQIAAGLKVLMNHELFRTSDTYRVLALVAHTRSIHTADLSRLRRPLRFGSQRVQIKPKRCGGPPI